MTAMMPRCLTAGLGRKQLSYTSSLYVILKPRHGATTHSSYLRHASTSSTPDSGRQEKKLNHPNPSPQERVSLVNQLPSRINPSTSTIPAPVNPPEREPNQNKVVWLFKVGKAYLTFYKTGVKNIWANRKIASELHQRLSKEKANQQKVEGSRSPWDIYKRNPLTRAENQLLLRSNYDMRRVPIFALVLLIFGEWTPLLVIFLTPIVPYTCRIPRQIDKARRAQEERRRASFRGETDQSLSIEEQQKKKKKQQHETAFVYNDVNVTLEQALHVCRSLGLYASVLDRVGFGPNSMLKRRIEERLTALAEDDILLLRDAIANDASPTSSRSKPNSDAAKVVARDISLEEIQMACEQRGIDTLEVPEAELRNNLNRWLTMVAKSASLSKADLTKGYMRLLYNRPNAWNL